MPPKGNRNNTMIQAKVEAGSFLSKKMIANDMPKFITNKRAKVEVVN